MRPKQSIKVIAALVLLSAVLPACQVPALFSPPASTPVPGAVETVIYETAAAAQTQTARVITPTSMATPTNIPSSAPTATDKPQPTGSPPPGSLEHVVG